MRQAIFRILAAVLGIATVAVQIVAVIGQRGNFSLTSTAIGVAFLTYAVAGERPAEKLLARFFHIKARFGCHCSSPRQLRICSRHFEACTWKIDEGSTRMLCGEFCKRASDASKMLTLCPSSRTIR